MSSVMCVTLFFPILPIYNGGGWANTNIFASCEFAGMEKPPHPDGSGGASVIRGLLEFSRGAELDAVHDWVGVDVEGVSVLADFV